MTCPRELALAHYRRHARDHIKDLEELVRIPSVSFPGFDATELRRSAEATADLLRRRGMSRVEILTEGDSHPYVFAERCPHPGAPTLLLYAHHDVQPAGDTNLWASPPFSPAVRNDRLYGRGSADDKAGIITHSAAIDAWVNGAGELPLNLKFLIEGEEEVGSPNLPRLIERHLEALRADAIVITDTGNLDTGVPSLTISLRGLVVVTIEVQALKQSVHSGSFGGPLPDPAMALCKILASLVDEDFRVTLPGFYDDAAPLSEAAKETLARLPEDHTRFAAQAGLLPGIEFLGSGGPWLESWWRPTLAINAIEASSRKDARNIINDRAYARVGVRLVAGMDPARVAEDLAKAARERAPWGVKVRAEIETASPAFATDTSHEAFAAACRALARGYGEEPRAIGAGGSIGFVAPMAEALGDIPVLLVGIEDPYSNAHSENESMSLGDLDKAAQSAIHLYDELREALP